MNILYSTRRRNVLLLKFISWLLIWLFVLPNFGWINGDSLPTTLRLEKGLGEKGHNEYIAPYTRFVNYFSSIAKDQSQYITTEEVLTQDAMQFYIVVCELHKRIIGEGIVEVGDIVEEFINRNIYFITDRVEEVEIEGDRFKYLEANVYGVTKYILFYPEDCPATVLRKIGIVSGKEQQYASMLKGVWITDKSDIFSRSHLIDMYHQGKVYPMELYLEEADKEKIGDVSLERVIVVGNGIDKTSFGINYIDGNIVFNRSFLEFLLKKGCHSIIAQAITDRDGALEGVSTAFHEFKRQKSMEVIIRNKIRQYVSGKVITEDEHDEVAGRARALNYLLRERKYLSGGLKDKLLKNLELCAVIFGLRPASILSLEDLNMNDQDIADLEYVLWCMKHITGESIKIMKLSEKRIYVYDENKLRARISQQERMTGTTTKGLEFLILRDVAKRRGVFYELATGVTYEGRKEALFFIAEAIINGDYDIRRIRKIEIKSIFLCTYGRPGALDRILKLQTENLKLFGHEDDVIFRIVDNTPGDTEDAGRNRKVIEKYRARGYKIEYRTRGESLLLNEKYVDYLYEKYSRELSAGQLDERIKREMVVDGRVIRERIKAIIDFTFNTQNIAGARNVTIAWGQKQRMASVDDDSLPLVLTVNRRKFTEIMEERYGWVQEVKVKMYEELNGLNLFPPINNEADFERFLTEVDLSRSDVRTVIEKYYTYSPDGATGLIPQVAGQIVHRDIEHRLRFDRLLHEGLPDYLAVSEDAISVNIDEEDIFNPTNTDLLPVDYLWVFDTTIGRREGGELGRVFERDLRGIAGGTDPNFRPENARRIMWASGHFNNARDNSAEALISEALGKWRRTGVVDIADLQQVVRMTVHISNDHSTSTGFMAGNQACCNMFAMDSRVYPVPTTGSWLRIEEPLQFLLVEFLTNQVMAWTKVAGGHKRIPGERRPDVPKQFLYEEIAMILYPLLVNLMLELNSELVEASPDIRIRRLGEEYIARARDFSIDPTGRGILVQTRRRVAEKIRSLLQERDRETNPDIRTQLELIANELREQFDIDGSEEQFIQKVTQILTRQFTDDGRTLFLWPDILKAVRVVGLTDVSRGIDETIQENGRGNRPSRVTIDGRHKLITTDINDRNRLVFLSLENKSHFLTRRDMQDFLTFQESCDASGVFNSLSLREGVDCNFIQLVYEDPCVNELSRELERQDPPIIGKIGETVIRRLSHPVCNFIFQGEDVDIHGHARGYLHEQSEVTGRFVKFLQEERIPHIVVFLPKQKGIIVFLLNNNVREEISLGDLKHDVSIPEDIAEDIENKFLTKRSYDLSKVRVVILVGGSGERMWPASTLGNPKQFCSFTRDSKTMLRRTLERAKAIVPIEQIYLLTLDSMVDTITEQEPTFPASNIISQPRNRNTGPAIGFAAVLLEKQFGPETTMVVLPADHDIPDKNIYYDAILEAIRAAQNDKNLVTIGIDPKGVAHTGYGYIKLEDRAEFLGPNTDVVGCFVEKPNLATAEKFVRGPYLWNAGMFVWKVGTILDAIRQYTLGIYKQLEIIRDALGIDDENGRELKILAAFTDCPSIQIDNAVIERVRLPFTIKNVRGSFRWSDIGNWDALPVAEDRDHNRIIGNAALNGVNNSIIYNASGEQVSVADVSNLVIVNFGDSTLVMNMAYSTSLKDVVRELGGNPNLKKYLRGGVTVPDKTSPSKPFTRSVKRHQNRDQINDVRGTVLVLDSDQCRIDSQFGLVVAFGVTGLEIVKTEHGLIVRQADINRAREKGFSQKYGHRDEGGINRRIKRMISDCKAKVINKNGLIPRDTDTDIPEEEDGAIIEKIEKAKRFLRGVPSTSVSNYAERVDGLSRRAIVVFGGDSYMLAAEYDRDNDKVIWQAAHNEPENRPETKTPGRNVIYLTKKQILELSVAQLAVLLNNEEVEMENPACIPAGIISDDDSHIMASAGTPQEDLDTVLHRFALMDILKELSTKGHEEIVKQYKMGTIELERQAEDILTRQEKPLGLILMSDFFLREIPPWKALELIARTGQGRVWVGVRNMEEKLLLERLNYKIVVRGQEVPVIENIVIVDESQLAMANRGTVPKQESDRGALMAKILIGNMREKLQGDISGIALMSNPLEILDDAERKTVQEKFERISRATKVNILVPEVNNTSRMVSTNLCVLKSIESTGDEKLGQVIILPPIESPQAFYNKLLEDYRAAIELLKNA